MPWDRARYPSDWSEAVARVRARAGDQCECRGECGHDHGLEGVAHREREGGDRCGALQGKPHPVTGSVVRLTTAHLWRGPCAEHHAAGVKCGDTSHLKAMCQRCHLAYDLPQHRANAARTRRGRRATGDLFGE